MEEQNLLWSYSTNDRKWRSWRSHRKPSWLKNMDSNISYLSHHGVFMFDRISTKYRIVLMHDAMNSKDVSLNSNLLPGPKRQLDIILLLINFRLHPFTLVVDISRMFHCINLDEKPRDYYRFSWNNSPNDHRFNK